MDHEAVARSRHDVDRTVRIADPDLLVRLQEHAVIPGIADFAAVAEEIAAFAVAPVEIAEGAQGAERRGDVESDAANEQAGADD